MLLYIVPESEKLNLAVLPVKILNTPSFRFNVAAASVFAVLLYRDVS